MRVYLDHNATTPINPRVKESFIKALDIYGNPSSRYEIGRRADYHINQSREIIAEFLNCSPREIIFTSGATESNNMVIKGLFYNESIIQKGDHLITTSIEHPSIINPCKSLEKKGFQVTYLSVNAQGLINLDELKQAIQPKTKLISIIHANNEIGTIQPIFEASQIARDHNILFHTDAVQSVGKIPISLNNSEIDFLSLSGHKLYAPKGVGLLYIKKSNYLSSLLEGGYQEGSMRAGTENVPGIIALGESFKLLKSDYLEKSNKIRSLRDHLEKSILESIEGTKINGHPEKRLPNTLNIRFDGIEGEAILLKLDLQGISVSTGSACHSESLSSSHVLKALGGSDEDAHSSIRFSLGESNTKEQIDFTIKTLIQVVQELRQLTAK